MAGPRRSAAQPPGFTERFAKVNGVRLRYLVGGQGSAVVLLHGYAETGHMWRPIMPLLAERHTVVVPDLRGAGGSAKPASGYDKRNMAVDIHELTASLKLDRVRIVGHDIGLMVAYQPVVKVGERTSPWLRQIVHCGPWRWASARASKRRCGFPRPSSRCRRGTRSTCA